MSKELQKRVRLTRWELAVLLDGMEAYKKEVVFQNGNHNENVQHIGLYLRREYERLWNRLHVAYNGRTF